MPKRRYGRQRRRRTQKSQVSLWMVFAGLLIAAVIFDLVIVTSQLGGSATLAPDSTPIATLTPTPKQTAKPTPNVSATALPTQALITMPFLVQAPFANWDPLHEDACEETSLIMVRHYLSKTTIPSKEAGDTEIKELVSAGESMGQGLSITLSQLVDLAVKHYDMATGRVETGDSVTIEAIKREIAEGRPVIIPAAGKLLPNSHFSNGGPNYHMPVVKGYDKDGFIANDPGIREGEGFRYTFDALYAAIHDWDPGVITNGQKGYLVFD